MMKLEISNTKQLDSWNGLGTDNNLLYVFKNMTDAIGVKEEWNKKEYVVSGNEYGLPVEFQIFKAKLWCTHSDFKNLLDIMEKNIIQKLDYEYGSTSPTRELNNSSSSIDGYKVTVYYT